MTMLFCKLPSGARMILYSSLRNIPKNSCSYSLASQQMDEQASEFYAKNKKFKRPKSPWIIFNLGYTSTLSLTHRATGIALYTVLTTSLISFTFLPFSFSDFIAYLDSLAIHPHVWTTIKFCLAFPFIFHVLNGIRSLVGSFTRFGHKRSSFFMTACVLFSFVAFVSVMAAKNG